MSRPANKISCCFKQRHFVSAFGVSAKALASWLYPLQGHLPSEVVFLFHGILIL
jgi:hypothetical protein